MEKNSKLGSAKANKITPHTILIDQTEYSFDIEKVFKCAFSDDDYIQTEVIQTFAYPGGSGVAREKELEEREVKTSGNPQKDSLKYDFIKTLVEFFMNIGMNTTINGAPAKVCSLDNLSFGEVTIFNTLVKYGILVPINK